MIKPSFFCIFFISLFASAQTPCNNNFAGTFPCNGYDLLSSVGVSTLANSLGNPEGSDIWGWVDPTNQREYAIAAMTNSTAFVDVTDPTNPIYLGRIDTQNGQTAFWRDVKIYNNYAFIVADGVSNHGMQVFDLTRLRSVTTPITFTADAVYSGVTSCHNIVINEAKSTAYLVDCKNTGRGVHFVDISDPLNPTSLGNYNSDGVSHDAQVVTYNGPDTEHTGKEIFIGSNETKVVILDVTDTNNIVKISEVTYSQLGYIHQGWLTEDHTYFILGDETDEFAPLGLNTRTLFFDFSDLDNPSLHATFNGPTKAIDHNGYVKGNKFYMANYTRGLVVFDISTISNASSPMSEIGFFDTYPNNNGTSFNGAWSVYPFFPSGNIIINDINRGLFVVKESATAGIQNPALAESLALYPNPIIQGNALTISLKENITSVKVYNVLGAEVDSYKNIDKRTFELPTDKLNNGVYLIRINGLISKKFVVK